MIWHRGDRPVDKFTVEERILRGLWLTGMNPHEARDWLKLHDTAQVKDAVNELYQQVWRTEDFNEEDSQPKKRRHRNAWKHGVNLGARLVWQQALKICDDYWQWWKDRYHDELEKPDLEKRHAEK